MPVGGKLLVHSLHDVTSQLRLFSLDGKAAGEVPLPGPGSALAPPGAVERRRAVLRLHVVHASRAATYRADVGTGKRGAVVAAAGAVRFAGLRDEAGLVRLQGRDEGADVRQPSPRASPSTAGGRRCSCGYGGFNVSLTARLQSPPRPGGSSRAASIAVPNLRGGGEFGEEWHRAGMLDKKQNVFDDFIAAAEWLIASRYTEPGRLAIRGASNGGPARGRRLHAAARAVPGRALRVPRPGHGRVLPLREQQPAGAPRVRRRVPARAVQVPLRVLAVPEGEAGHGLSGGPLHHRRRRHARAAAAGAQDDGAHAGGHVLGPAGAAPLRHQGRPRRRPARRQAGGRPLAADDLPGRQLGMEVR